MCKNIVCILFYLKKVELTQQNLLGQFCHNSISRLRCTSGFKMWEFNYRFYGQFKPFKKFKKGQWFKVKINIR